MVFLGEFSFFLYIYSLLKTKHARKKKTCFNMIEVKGKKENGLQGAVAALLFLCVTVSYASVSCDRAQVFLSGEEHAEHTTVR